VFVAHASLSLSVSAWTLSSTRALDAARLPLGVGGGGGVGRRGGGAAAGRGAPANHEEARCGGGKGSSG